MPHGEGGQILRTDIGGLLSPEAFQRAKAAEWPSDMSSVMDIVQGEPNWEFGRVEDQEHCGYLVSIYRDELVYIEPE